MNNIFNIIEEANKDKLLERDKNFLINECGMESVVVNKMSASEISRKAEVKRASKEMIKRFHKVYEALA